MKKIIGLGLAVTLISGFTYAGMRTTYATNANGVGYGLPVAWTLRVAAGYDDAVNTVNYNPGSAMCVECHTVNPSSKVLIPTVTGEFTAANLLSTSSRGTHFVMNYTSVLATTPTAGVAAAGTTHTGGGFVGGFGNAARNAGEYEKVTNWLPAAGGSGGDSKYQTNVAGSTTLNSQFNVAGDMVCESCHNLEQNMGENLVLANYTDNGDSTLCVNCHTTMHTNGNLPGFAGTTVRKRHHVLMNSYGTTIDTLSLGAGFYNGNGSASQMWAPAYSASWDASWCATPYTNITPGLTLDLSAGVAVAYRNLCNVSGQGTYSAATVRGAGVGGDVVPADATINCANCHRPHNAMTGGGAFILRGGNTITDNFTVTEGGVDYRQGSSRALPANADTTGLRRQYDVGAYSANQIYVEYKPLCVACHRNY